MTPGDIIGSQYSLSDEESMHSHPASAKKSRKKHKVMNGDKTTPATNAVESISQSKVG